MGRGGILGRKRPSNSEAQDYGGHNRKNEMPYAREETDGLGQLDLAADKVRAPKPNVRASPQNFEFARHSEQYSPCPPWCE